MNPPVGSVTTGFIYEYSVPIVIASVSVQIVSLFFFAIAGKAKH